VTDHFAVVSAGTDRRVGRDNLPQDGDDQGDGQLAYRMDRISRGVMKDDPASLARILIHVIDAGKCHANQLEVGASLDHCPGKRPIAQQENVSVTNFVDQIRIGHASCVADEQAMAALFKQILEPRLDRWFGLADGFNYFNIHELPLIERAQTDFRLGLTDRPRMHVD
jgi:hypothetical protein